VAAPSGVRNPNGGALTRKETYVSEDQKEFKERKEERPEDVEAHKWHEPDQNEEADVEGHVLEKSEQKEMKE
jgi:hypothetical protein